ncbi:MAG TPA: recombinase family protein [Thermoanaerobaculia bacterium]|nr:recombinase family protein [Thermoanaerobaculia bacterium]
MAGCVVYIRVSTEEQVANLSLDTQDAACRAYAARQGWDVLRVYREEGESAKTAQRPVLQRLLDDLERRRFHPVALVVYDLSRLARETLARTADMRAARPIACMAPSGPCSHAKPARPSS